LLLPRTARLLMVGAEPGERPRLELYFRVHGLSAAELARLLAAAGLEARAGELQALLDAAWQGSAAHALASSDCGVSLSLPWGGGPDRFTLFKRAGSIL